MTGRKAPGRTCRGALAPFAALLVIIPVSALDVTAQQLPLKTAPPPGAVLICDDQAAAAMPAPVAGDTVAAARLVNAATQSMLLGDLDGALEFLDRALLLDPTATEALYLQGRIRQRLGSAAAAAASLCAFLQVDPTNPLAQEVRQRLDDARDQGVGRPLLDTYRRGVALEQEGRLGEAEAAFTEFLSARPSTADALYNRALVRAALGRDEAARSDLQSYLALDPAATDAIEIQRLLGFAATMPRPRPGAAFVRGALVPGGGQFYTGRPLVGAAITALAGGALAVGILSERTTIRCLDAAATVCPEDRIASRETERPWLLPAVGAAVGLSLGAAIEATVYVRRAARSTDESRARMPGPARFLPVDGVRPHGPALQVELVRLHF
jgi:tetratricopeptide (TPR) repeat protein